MTTIVGLDRDGTINYNEDDYYLGSTRDWKNKVRFLDGVSEGIRLLNSAPNTHIFILTNQPAVGVEEPRFAEFTEDRMHEVNQYIVKQLAIRGAHVNGYFACPYVDDLYRKKALERGWKIRPEYFCQNGHPDIKPNVGMLRKCASELGIMLQDATVYVVGDRSSDVSLGINGGGTGIFVQYSDNPKGDELDRVEELRRRAGSRVQTAKSFLEAANYIRARIPD